MNRFKIYLAGPLFSVAEREFNERLACALIGGMPNLSFILPQEHAKIIYGQAAFSEKVFEYCINSIDEADALLCILDGPDVDSGTCIEMGYAYACKKPIIGVRTDLRSSEDKGTNLMVSNVCREMIWLPSSLVTLQQVVDEIVAVLNRVLLKTNK